MVGFWSRPTSWLADGHFLTVSSHKAKRESKLPGHQAFILWPHLTLITSLPQMQSHWEFSSDQPLSRVRLFVTPWIAACQASLSITNSRSSLKLMCIESVMPSSHLILCRPLLLLPPSLPASESFPMSQLFTWGGQSTGVSALASFLPKNTQGWSPLEWTGWISLQIGSWVVFYSKSVNASMFPWVLWAFLANYWVWEGDHKKPNLWLVNQKSRWQPGFVIGIWSGGNPVEPSP